MALTLVDFFCGAGGSSQGAVAVPGVTARLAANHWQRAIDTHAANFPATEHYRGDLHDADVAKFPAGDLFWASPECPAWSQARGRQRDYDKQPDLFGEVLPDEAADRSRALMWDVPRYLEAMTQRGTPVLAGVVENVTDVRAWSHWHLWVAAIRNLGYRTRLVAINSMHARPRVTPPAPQSRDRLYLAYWAACLGRDPDWDRWLRPAAWCPICQAEVWAVQCWKRPGQDMGRYRQQYLYRCPRHACRNAVVEPAALPAAAAIDWDDLGTRIGDRARPMRPATRARIAAGLARYARPITIEAAGHTFERRPGTRAWPADAPLTAADHHRYQGPGLPAADRARRGNLARRPDPRRRPVPGPDHPGKRRRCVPAVHHHPPRRDSRGPHRARDRPADRCHRIGQPSRPGRARRRDDRAELHPARQPRPDGHPGQRAAAHADHRRAPVAGVVGSPARALLRDRRRSAAGHRTRRDLDRTGPVRAGQHTRHR